MTDADIDEAARDYTYPVKDYHRKHWEQMAFKAGAIWASGMVFFELHPEEKEKLLEDLRCQLLKSSDAWPTGAVKTSSP